MTVRQRRTALCMGTALIIAVVLTLLRSTYLLQAAELKTLDARFRTLRHASDADKRIVIVDVDNLSVDLARKTLGRWPWPRSAWATVIDFVTAGGARAIAFDFVFAEPNFADSAGDAAFVESSARAGNVIQAIALQSIGDTSEIQSSTREDTAAVRTLLTFGIPASSATSEFQAVQHPFPQLLAAARSVGSINFTPDSVDGSTRRIPLSYQFRGKVFPAFGLAVARVADSARVRSAHIPLDRTGAMILNWHGPYRDRDTTRVTYPVIPIAQIFNSYEKIRTGGTPDVALESFKDKIVLVGSSASGLFDARANPFGAAEPGVLIHATLVDNLLNHDFLKQARGTTNVALLFLLCLLAGLIVAAVATVWLSATLAVAVALVYAGIAAWMFTHNIWVDAAAPTLGILLTFTGGMTVNYMTEGKQKRQIRDMFSKYVAPEYVAQLAEDPTKLHLDGRRAELSILFSDIRGFTSISEKLEPTEVIAFLNEYLDEMAEIVKQSGGTLDKFIGDAVMAFWGEPIRIEDHAQRACDCALAMRDATRAIAERFEREGKPAIQIGIGVNTADVVVGNIGSLKHKLDYTVIGDGVNLASRLEGTNKEFGTTIIISEFTLAKIGDRYETRPLGGVNVKGKAKEVQIYELLGRSSERIP